MLKNNKGFSLTQILVSAGLMGVMALGFMRMSKTGSQVTAKTESLFDTNMLLQDIHRRLSHSTLCEETFGGKNLDPEISVPALIQDGHPIFQTTSRMNKVEVLDYTLKIDSAPTSGAGTAFGYLNITVKHSNASGGRKLVKTIPVILKVDASNKIEKCISDRETIITNTRIEICSDLGGKIIDGKCTQITPIIGDDTSIICNSVNSGKIRYNPAATDQSLEICNGTNWEVIKEKDHQDCPSSTAYMWGPAQSHYMNTIATGPLKHMEIIYRNCPTSGFRHFQCQNGVLKDLGGSCSPPGP